METEGVKIGAERLTAIILSLSTSQKMLTQSALDLQALCLAKKHQIEDAIDRAVDVGDILDGYISLLEAETRLLDGDTGGDKPITKQSSA